MSLLALQQATFAGPGGCATAAVDVDVRPGELVVLELPTAVPGAAIARGSVGLTPAVSGQVTLFGVPIVDNAHEDLLKLRQRTAISSPGLPLLSNMSVRENVAFPLLMRGGRRQDVLALVDALLEQLGLAQHLDTRPEELPATAEALARVGRALAVPAELLVVDHPPRDDAVRALLDDKRAQGVGILVLTSAAADVPNATRALQLRPG